MKKKLLIINQKQFGYHSDTYYYCKYLRNSFDITYICWHYNQKEITLNNIEVIYISRKGNIVLRNVRFMFRVFEELKNNYHFHFIKYFRGCSLLKLLSQKQNFLIDIRSASIANKRLNRFIYNLLMKLELRFFNHISVISKSLSQKLGLSKKAYILPLGADIISIEKKTFSSIKLLYVGTLYNRNINQTIKGYSKFYHKYKNSLKINYTIVGSGYNREEQELKKLAKHEKVDSSLEIAGQIPHDKIKSFFDSHNIGVSYIPKTEYFTVQPPTKTFEYFLSGMPVIATDTLENKAIMSTENGVLINDTAEDFYQGLVCLYKNKKNYDSNNIRLNSIKYTWNIIVDDLSLKLHSLIESNHSKLSKSP